MAIRTDDVAGIDFSDVAGPERIGPVNAGGRAARGIHDTARSLRSCPCRWRRESAHKRRRVNFWHKTCL
jgi:hypothetical protein